MFLQETYSLEDCLFYGINVTAFTIPQDTTFTQDGAKITATTSTNSEKVVYFNHTFTNADNWVFETEVAQVSPPQSIAVLFNDNSFYGGQYPTSTNKAFYNMGSNITFDHVFNVGDKYRIIREDGVTSIYLNDEKLGDKTTSHKPSFKLGYYITKNRTQYYKNIKIKPL